LAQKDAVRVKSCWGGMVAFEARWFQPEKHATQSMQAPLRFRAENETYWDASERCLLQADLTALAPEELAFGETGIYMNPYVRVAYSEATFDCLSFAKRFERLYPPIQAALNWLSRRPNFNPRRLERAGEIVTRREWVWKQDASIREGNGTQDGLSAGVHGGYENVTRVARPGSFCGKPGLRYIDEVPHNGKRHCGLERVPAG